MTRHELFWSQPRYQRLMEFLCFSINSSRAISHVRSLMMMMMMMMTEIVLETLLS